MEIPPTFQRAFLNWECASSNPPRSARQSSVWSSFPGNARLRRKSALFTRSISSPDSQIGNLRAQIGESLRPCPRIFPFCGEFRRRLGSIRTAARGRGWFWPASHLSRPFRRAAASRRSQRLSRPVLWCLRGRDLFAPALARVGLHPDRVIYCETWKDRDVLPATGRGVALQGARLRRGRSHTSLLERLAALAALRRRDGRHGACHPRWRNITEKGLAGEPTLRIPAGASRPIPPAKSWKIWAASNGELSWCVRAGARRGNGLWGHPMRRVISLVPELFVVNATLQEDNAALVRLALCASGIRHW
jgi:hypothetical protein